MIKNAFIGNSKPPTERELADTLGPPGALWRKLLADLRACHDVDGQEWNSYSKKAGWSLRLKRGKRAIVYLSPSQGCFMASFALGAKAVEAARPKLPRSVVAAIDKAKVYPEGRGVRVEVRTAEDLAAVETLAAAKAGN